MVGQQSRCSGASFIVHCTEGCYFLPDPEIPNPFLFQGIHSILPSNMTRKKYRVHKVSRTDKVGKVKFLKKGTV